MAIRKDIDDMLNNLKSGAPKAQEQPKPPVKKAAPRKSVYDDMSVDDLLSALAVEKKPQTAPTAATPPSAAPETKAAPTAAPIDPKAEKAAVKAPEAAAPKSSSSVDTELQEKLSRLMPRRTQSTAAVPEKPSEEKAPISESVPEPPKPEEKKKKKIVISGELPDYEAIRREELEKNRIENERAAAAAKSAAARANELTPVEAIAAEAIAAREEKKAEPEVIEEAVPADAVPVDAVPEDVVPEDVVPEDVSPEDSIFEDVMPEDKHVKEGFFAKRRNKRRKEAEAAEKIQAALDSYEEAEYAAAEGTVPTVEDALTEESAPVEEAPESVEAVEAVDAFAETENEAPAQSVDEMLDAAIAEIKATMSSEAEDGADSGEMPSPNENEAPEENNDATDAAATAEESAESDDASEIPSGETVDVVEDAEIELPEPEPVDAPTPVKPKKLVLRRILDENPDDIINERSEKTEAADSDEAPQKGKFKKRLYTVLGVIFSIFAVVGIVTAIVWGVKLIKGFTTGEVKREGFEELIYPAVIMDIDSFEKPEELTSNQMLTAAIWSIIMSDDLSAKYTVNPGTDTISIPYMDVEARAVAMFGPAHPEFQHCTLGPLDSRFFYSDGAYNVKLNTITFTYSPEIKSIVKSGSKYTLTVDYIDELPQWMEKSVAKSVEFTLEETAADTYVINSMEVIFVKSSNI